jgi:hypothetical protein
VTKITNEVSPLEVSTWNKSQLEDEINSIKANMCKLEEDMINRFQKLEK